MQRIVVEKMRKAHTIVGIVPSEPHLHREREFGIAARRFQNAFYRIGVRQQTGAPPMQRHRREGTRHVDVGTGISVLYEKVGHTAQLVGITGKHLRHHGDTGIGRRSDVGKVLPPESTFLYTDKWRIVGCYPAPQLMVQPAECSIGIALQGGKMYRYHRGCLYRRQSGGFLHRGQHIEARQGKEKEEHAAKALPLRTI